MCLIQFGSFYWTSPKTPYGDLRTPLVYLQKGGCKLLSPGQTLSSVGIAHRFISNRSSVRIPAMALLFTRRLFLFLPDVSFCSLPAITVFPYGLLLCPYQLLLRLRIKSIFLSSIIFFAAPCPRLLSFRIDYYYARINYYYDSVSNVSSNNPK